MNEAIRNLVMLIWTVSAVSTNAEAQVATVHCFEEELPSKAIVATVKKQQSDKSKQQLQPRILSSVNVE